jgi:hypothetical protein
MKYILILFFIIISENSISQVKTQQLIKTTEYVGNKIRRELYYTEDLNLVKEEYYSDKDQKIVNTIVYNNKNEIINVLGYHQYPKVLFSVDFEKGIYVIPEEELELKFKDWFVFDGIQKSKNIIVKYVNGIKNGKLVQADSGVIKDKGINYNKADPNNLKFNINRFYNEIKDESTFKLFNGLSLNFSNNQLNGEQNKYYINGNLNISSEFILDKLKKYSSFSSDGNVISKIISDTNQIITKPYILNGVIQSENLEGVIITNDELSKTGDITYVNDFEASQTGDSYNSFNFHSESRLGKIEFMEIIEYYFSHVFQTPNYPSTSDIQKFYTSKIEDFSICKKQFDKAKIVINENNPHIIRVLLQIPIFEIRKYNFNKNDESNLIVTPFKSNSEKSNLLENYISNKEKGGSKEAIINEDSIYSQPEIQAESIIGPLAMQQYLERQIKSLYDFDEKNLSGTLVIRFIVETDGNISKIEAMSCHEANVEKCIPPISKFSKTVINIIRKGPKWKPATINGKTVRSFVTIKSSLSSSE